ncbi:MAG: hypothetical protein IH840_02060 [Candidatus Heimdallarchaeota archaeon]|nr:hypothetical protein [Candidatus Heimdallarchaeota archaeon]
MFYIDGGVGGGSVLRVGVPLALALNKSINVINVRRKRKRRGLRTQHLTGLQLLCQLTGSYLEGGAIGSSEITVRPNFTFVSPNKHPMIQLPTSAAVSLIIQTLSNYVFASRKPIGFDFIGGGTHVSFSPNFDVLLHANKPLFEMFGLRLHIQLMKPGFYPIGGGMGRIYMEPVPFSKIELQGGKVEEIFVISNGSSDLRRDTIAEKHVAGFKSVFPEARSSVGYADAESSGSSCSAIIKFDSGAIKSVARMGGSGLDPVDVGRRTAQAAQKEIKSPAALDEQLSDQLILPLAYSPSGSTYTFEKIYPHIEANLDVVNQILGDVIKLEQNDGYYSLFKI